MKRLEERVTCEDAQGLRYEVEVFREITRLDDGSQALGRRDAHMAGDPARPLKVFDDQNTFQTPEGSTLRRVRGAAKVSEKPKGRGWRQGKSHHP